MPEGHQPNLVTEHRKVVLVVGCGVILGMGGDGAFR